MQRRTFFINTAFTTAGILLTQKSLLASIFQTPAFKITMLNENMGIFTEQGGTILFLLSNDGIVVVDSQFPAPATHLIEELKKKSDKPFVKLINTHHHGDHTGGNISFKGIAEHVVAHENSKTNQQKVAIAQKKEDQNLYPDQTYTIDWSEKIGKEKVSLHYFGPGHTNGDSFVHFEHANIVHMGDLLFNRRHPFVDRTAGANIASWITVLNKAEKKFSKKTTFVYGHSQTGFEVTGKIDDLKQFGDYLGNLLKFTDAEIKAGKTKEEILKTTTLPFKTEWSGDGLARPLGAAYEELTMK